MGARNESVLIQEYIDGTEFYVDSVSYKGTHIPVDIFQYKKGHHNGHSFIYEKEYFINSDDPNWENLAVFSQKALDALQFHTGPSHMEVKINSKDEIVFIEVGARLSGGDTHLLTQETRLDGLSQVQLSIDAYLDLPAPERKYSSKKFGIRNYIVSNKKGVLKKYKSIEQIQKLNSFSRMNLVYKEGSTIKPTIDMASDAGWIDLSHSNKNQISNDEKILDQLLFEGIFCLE